MILKILLFVCGVISCALSLCFLLIYINLINMGYSFKDYVHFISRKFECWLLLIGIILIILSIIKRKGK